MAWQCNCICSIVYLIRQGVVTYMTCDQSPFGGRSRDQGGLQAAKSTVQNTQLQFDLLPMKIKRSRALEGNDEAIKHTFCHLKILIVVANASTGNTSDYPLSEVYNSF